MQEYQEKKDYKTLIFDLDGTLAVSKSPISKKMASLLSEASKTLNIVIITGGKYKQIVEQVLNMLTLEADLKKIYILPTSGAQMYSYSVEENRWKLVYSETFNQEQEERILNSLKSALEKTSFTILPEDLLGEQIEVRGHSQITFSALGQEQLPEIKEKWDPNQEKRKEIVKYLSDLTEEFDIKIGGTTSIDITLKGIDKEFGIKHFFKETNLNIQESLFVGDMIFPGGNDWAATKTDIDIYKTKNPKDTAILVRNILNNKIIK